MSAERYEITSADHGAIRIDHSSAHLPHKFVCIHPGADPWSAFSHGVIRQQERELTALQQVISEQIKVIDDLEHSRVKVCDENDQLRAELATAIAERDELRAEHGPRVTQLFEAVAERDDYRDEFSGLCHTLSVGSEGQPEMTAADWRKRVDQGIDFLTRPLLSRIEATDKELAKRSSMLDICTQNCSDWIGRWRAEQERAEQAEARLAAIDAQTTLAIWGGWIDVSESNVPPDETELIARPAKD